MDAEHRWLAKTEPGAGGRPASVEKGLGRDHFSFSYSQAIVYCAASAACGEKFEKWNVGASKR